MQHHIRKNIQHTSVPHNTYNIYVTENTYLERCEETKEAWGEGAPACSASCRAAASAEHKAARYGPSAGEVLRSAGRKRSRVTRCTALGSDPTSLKRWAPASASAAVRAALSVSAPCVAGRSILSIQCQLKTTTSIFKELCSIMKFVTLFYIYRHCIIKK